MASHGPSPLPPTTILSTRSIPQSSAHDFLAAYLERAATDPALQPNAGVSEHGPVSRTTAAAPNLILHNLKRVQAGLAGEILGRDLALAKLKQGLGRPTSSLENRRDAEEEWEDANQFQQGVDADQVEDQDQRELMDVDNAEAEVMTVPAPASGVLDKEERKRKKKERRLAEKRIKAKGTED